MVKYTQTIHQQFADELFEWFDHFMNLALKGLKVKCEGELRLSESNLFHSTNVDGKKN